MSDWQDISTAPKDGRVVLLYDNHSGQMMCAEYVSPDPSWEDAPDELLGYPWRCSVEPSSAYAADAFTHWRDVPAPPHSKEIEG